MPSIVGRNYLYQCFTKTKSPLPQQLQSTPYRDLDHPQSTLIRNFNSLYGEHEDHVENGSKSIAAATNDAADATLDFATIHASQRFFFSSPGRSNSIIDSTASSSLSSSRNIPESDHNSSSNTNGIAVDTYSPDPYADFRRSMQEMVEAQDLRDVRANWDRLHELLMCYLALNPKSAHKYIVRAFADLLVSLMPSSPPETRHRHDGGCSNKGAVVVNLALNSSCLFVSL